MKSEASSRRQFLISSACGVSATWVALHWPAILSAHHHAQAAAASQEPTALQFLSAEQATEVEAMSAQIIPTDDTPGAREAHIVYFVDRALMTFDRNRQPDYTQGLAQLQAKTQSMFPGTEKFSQLRPKQQIHLLTAIQHTKFFELIRIHTIMGCFANPEYAGNYNKVGWKLIGFEDNFYYQPPFGYYDAKYSKAMPKPDESPDKG